MELRFRLHIENSKKNYKKQRKSIEITTGDKIKNCIKYNLLETNEKFIYLLIYH